MQINEELLAWYLESENSDLVNIYVNRSYIFI